MSDSGKTRGRETLYLTDACDDGTDNDADILHGKLEKMTVEKKGRQILLRDETGIEFNTLGAPW